MKRINNVLTTLGVLVSVLSTATALTGCGGNRTGGPNGSGGVGAGGVTETGGSGGPTAGGNSGTSAGGSNGTGGAVGSGGNPSGVGGGNSAGGRGGATTFVSDAGGVVDGGLGGAGTGGRAAGGAGGSATGGAPGVDGGAPGIDGRALDAPPSKCGDVTTQDECDARTDCHSVFVDPGNCNCAASGCCARFQGCADGDKANCEGAVACAMALPHCESPYIVSVRGSCYEGCVRQTDCALPSCPQAPPANGAPCGPVPVSQTCYYEDCAGVGRTVATCSAGASAWQVTTGSCAPIACEASPDATSRLTCPAGKVCIITTTSGPTPPIATPTCVDHTCGTGPITPDCVPSLYGTCTETYSTGGAVFQCQTVSNCGQPICA